MVGVFNSIVNKFQRDLCMKVELPKPNWQHAAQIMYVYRYPVMWGLSRRIQSNKFTREMYENVHLHKRKIWDGMFVVYDKQTLCVQNCENTMAMSKMEMIPIDLNIVMFRCEMTSKDLVVDLRYIHENMKVECYTTLFDKFLVTETCIDCGSKAALWISNALRNDRLRMGFCLPQQGKEITFWECYSKLYDIYGDERNITINRWDVPMIKIVSITSAIHVKRNVDRNEVERDFMPNILITSKLPFIEHKWKWIKMGHAVFRNIRRLSDANITDLKTMPLEMRWKMLPTYWEMYYPGYVYVNQDVLTHVPRPDDIESLLELSVCQN